MMLVAALLSLGLAPVLHEAAERGARRGGWAVGGMQALDTWMAVVASGVVLLEVMPESVEHLGVYAIAIALLGATQVMTDVTLDTTAGGAASTGGDITLGDLTKVTEPELLEGKNFGETSLVEIRELMAAHGLQVGQELAVQGTKETSWGGPVGTGLISPDLSPQEQAMLARSVSDLNLSVRARKCMSRLGITALSELVQRTPDELLATKNFGVTSLNEIRQQLGELNLKLRND